MRLVSAAALCVVTTMAAPPVAVAQQSEAQLLFDRGRALLEAGECDQAIEKFRASYEIDPAPGTLLNLAECYLKLDKLASAWSTYREAEALASSSGQTGREVFAREEADKLEAKVSRVKVIVPVEARVDGLQVVRNDVVLRPALYGESVPVDSGPVLVKATAPGKEAWSERYELGGGAQNIDVTVPVLADLPVAPAEPAPATAPAARPPPPAPADPGPAAERNSGRFISGFVVGGTGLALVGISGGLYARSQSTIDDANCPNETCVEGVGDPRKHEKGRDQERRSFVVGGFGLGLVVTGVILVATSGPSEPRSARSRVRVSAGGGPGMLGVSATGRF